MGRVKRERADRLLVARDLVESRTRAQALILAGRVFSGEARVGKARVWIRRRRDDIRHLSR